MIFNFYHQKYLSNVSLLIVQKKILLDFIKLCTMCTILGIHWPLVSTMYLHLPGQSQFNSAVLS